MMQSLNVLMSQANRSLLLEVLSKQDTEGSFGISVKAAANIIAVCNNSVSMIDMAKRYRPKMIFTDLFLEDIDAFTLMKRIKEQMGAEAPGFIVLCDVTAPRLERELYEAGASAVLTKPVQPKILSDLFAEDRFAKPAAIHAENETAVDPDMHELEVTVTDMMHQLGVPAHIKGYHYIRYAIIMSVIDPGIINAVTKRLYPTVAEKFSTTPSRVERAIRHAIEVAWDRGDIDMLNSYFGYTIHNSRGKPTNSEFVAMLSDKLRIGMLAAV